MNEADYKTIDQYLQGELSDEQEAVFKKRLADDEAFAAAYTLNQQMTHYLKAKLKQPALEAKMAALGPLYFKAQKSTKAKVIKMPFLRIAISVAAVLLLLMIVWNPFASSDLYTQFAEHPSLSLTEKSVSSSLIQQAEQAYTNKEYETAYTALAKILETDSDNAQAKLALGISALELGKLENAQHIFSELANGTSGLKSYGQWYLALSYMKQGEDEKAKLILEKLNNDEPALKKKAGRLIELLRNS